MKMFRKIICFVCALVMMLGMLPLATIAEELELSTGEIRENGDVVDYIPEDEEIIDYNPEDEEIIDYNPEDEKLEAEIPENDDITARDSFPYGNLVTDPFFAQAVIAGMTDPWPSSGWGSRNIAATVNLDLDFVRSGHASVRIPQRGADFHGPGVFIEGGVIEAGVTYSVEFWVLSPYEVMDFTIRAAVTNPWSENIGSPPWLLQAIGPSDGWVRLSNTFTFTEAQVEGARITRGPLFWIRTAGATQTASFYIDSAVVRRVDDTLSNNTDIDTLTVTHGTTVLTPLFDVEERTFTVEVPEDVTDITIDAIAYNADAWLELDGIFRETATLTVTGGVNTFPIRVFGEDNIAIGVFSLIVQVGDDNNQTENEWFVSSGRTGGFADAQRANGDGTSWETAWNELNQIEWNLVNPGDTIWIDGGPSNGSMTYNTQLRIGASGVTGYPITIRVSNEAGRDGQAIFFGGRSVPLPEAFSQHHLFDLWSISEPGFAQTYDRIGNEAGIHFNGHHHIIVDGSRWHGIVVHGSNCTGVYMAGDHITIRGLHIFDNGAWNRAQNRLDTYGFFDELAETFGPRMRGEPLNQFMTPDAVRWALTEGGSSTPGVVASGQYITVEFTVIHDNGEDGIQDGRTIYTPYYGPPHATSGGFNIDWRQGSDLTVDHSWIYSSRLHSIILNEPAGGPMHVGTIQYWTARNAMRENMAITNTILGPLSNTSLSGGGTSEILSARTHNSTMIGFRGYYSHAALSLKMISADAGVTANRYMEWNNNTFVAPYEGVMMRHIQSAANNVQINDNIFVGGSHLVFMNHQPTGIGNFHHRISNPVNAAGATTPGLPANFTTAADPQFANSSIHFLGGMGYDGFDFTPTNPLMQNTGSTITSVGVLYSILHPDWTSGNVLVSAPPLYDPLADDSLYHLSVFGVPLDGPVVNGNRTDTFFRWDNHHYQVTVGANATSIRVSALRNNPAATVTINGETVPPNQPLSPSPATRVNPNFRDVPISLHTDNVIEIVVTAVNGSTRTYTITVNRDDALAGNMLINSGFETNANNWTGLNAAVARDTAAQHGGNNSLNITGRTWQSRLAGAGGPQQDITAVLRAAGNGLTFDTGAYVRASAAGDGMYLRVTVRVESRNPMENRVFSTAVTPVSSSEWTKIGGPLFLSWSGELERATWFIEGVAGGPSGEQLSVQGEFFGASTQPFHLASPYLVIANQVGATAVMTWRNNSAAAFSVIYDDPPAYPRSQVEYMYLQRTHGIFGEFGINPGRAQANLPFNVNLSETRIPQSSWALVETTPGSGMVSFPTWWDFMEYLWDEGYIGANNHSYTHPLHGLGATGSFLNHGMWGIPNSAEGRTNNPAPGSVVWQIEQANAAAERELGRTMGLFTYPESSYNRDIVRYMDERFVMVRGGNPGLNPSNLTNYYNISTIGNAPTRYEEGHREIYGEGVPRQAIMANVDTAISTGAWHLLSQHNTTSDPGGWAAVPYDKVDEIFAYVASRGDLVWNALPTEVAKYLRQRNSTTITSSENDGVITVNIGFTDTLNDNNTNIPEGRLGNVTDRGIVYNLPLTFRTVVPFNWRAANVVQNGVATTVAVSTEFGNSVIYFDAIPNGGAVTITEAADIPSPVVTSVNVSPNAVRMEINQVQRFIATVIGDNLPSQDVTWSVIGGTLAGTRITLAGVLMIDEDEVGLGEEFTLTVRATSVQNPAVFGEVTVEVFRFERPDPMRGNLATDPHLAGGTLAGTNWFHRAAGGSTLNVSNTAYRSGGQSAAFTFGDTNWAGAGITVPLSEARIGEKYYVEAWIYSPDVTRRAFWTAIANGEDNHRPLNDGSMNWFWNTFAYVGPEAGWQRVWAIMTFPNERHPDIGTEITTSLGFHIRTMENAHGTFYIDNALAVWIPADMYRVDENGIFDHSVLRELLSYDGSLESITLSHNGANPNPVTPVWNAALGAYTATVPEDATEITITATANCDYAWVELAGRFRENATLSVPNALNTFTIRVFPEYNQTIHSFPLRVTIDGAQLSNDAALSALSVCTGILTPGFTPDTLSYTVNVANNVTAVTITATARHAQATISGDIGLQENLVVGDNVFSITVIAEDNTERVYTVTVVRALPRDTDALGNFAFDPHLAATTTFPNTAVGSPGYTAPAGSWGFRNSLGAGGGRNTNPEFIRSGDASFRIGERPAGAFFHGAGIFMPLEHLEPHVEYIVEFWVLSPYEEMNFSFLLIAPNATGGWFNPYTYTYNGVTFPVFTTTTVGDEWTKVTARILLGNNILDVGNNPFIHLQTSLLYAYYVDSVLLARADEHPTLGTDVSIDAISITHPGGTGSPAFNAETNTFTLLVPEGTPSVDISAVATDEFAWLELDGQFRGTMTLPVTSGANEVAIRVFAENNTDIGEFTLIVTVDGDTGPDPWENHTNLLMDGNMNMPHRDYWAAWGTPTILKTTAQTHSGMRSLSVSNRASGFHVARQWIVPFGVESTLPGGRYYAEAWVLIPEDQPAQSMAMMIVWWEGGTAERRIIQEEGWTVVEPGIWTRLSGYIEVPNSLVSPFISFTVFVNEATAGDGFADYFLDSTRLIFTEEDLNAPPAPGNEFFVSRSAPAVGGNGLSWETAWNDFHQIDWRIIRPGDTIWIDGGPANGSMRYDEQLRIGASGREGAPVTIRVSDEPGRNGRAIFFGGRSVPLPESYEKDAQFRLPTEFPHRRMFINPELEAGLRPPATGFHGNPIIFLDDKPNSAWWYDLDGTGYTPWLGTTGDQAIWEGWIHNDSTAAGIHFRGHEHVVVDGARWNGIEVTGANDVGVWMQGNHLTIRGLLVHDNAWFGKAQDGFTFAMYRYGMTQEQVDRYRSNYTISGIPGAAQGPGVRIDGNFLNIEFTEIFDAGEDGIQDESASVSGPFPIGNNITVDHTWIYFYRLHSILDEPYGAAMHTDTIQFWEHRRGTSRENFTISNSILQGPGTVFDDVAMHNWHHYNVLYMAVDGLGGAYHGSIQSGGFHAGSSNWHWERVTFAAPYNMGRRHLQLAATDAARITDSIFSGRGDGGQPIWVARPPIVANSFFSGGTPGFYTASNMGGWVVPENMRVSPDFVNPHFTFLGGPGYRGFDFTPTNPQILASGAGTSITSVWVLYDQRHPDWICRTLENVVVTIPTSYTGPTTNDATLARLSTDFITIAPVFRPHIKNYNVVVYSHINSITVRGYTHHPNASFTVNGVTAVTSRVPVALNVGPNVITVVVTAANGVDTATYTLNVYREAMVEDLLVNTSFATNIANWSGMNATVTRDTTMLHEGRNSLAVTNRTSSALSGPTQTFTASLQSVGNNRTVNTGAWIRASEPGEGTYMRITVLLTTTTESRHFSTAVFPVSSTEWTHIGGPLHFDWEGTLTSAVWYVEGVSGEDWTGAATRADFHMASPYMHIMEEVGTTTVTTWLDNMRAAYSVTYDDTPKYPYSLLRYMELHERFGIRGTFFTSPAAETGARHEILFHGEASRDWSRNWGNRPVRDFDGNIIEVRDFDNQVVQNPVWWDFARYVVLPSGYINFANHSNSHPVRTWYYSSPVNTPGPDPSGDGMELAVQEFGWGNQSELNILRGATTIEELIRMSRPISAGGEMTSANIHNNTGQNSYFVRGSYRWEIDMSHWTVYLQTGYVMETWANPTAAANDTATAFRIMDEKFIAARGNTTAAHPTSGHSNSTDYFRIGGNMAVGETTTVGQMVTHLDNAIARGGWATTNGHNMFFPNEGATANLTAWEDGWSPIAYEIWEEFFTYASSQNSRVWFGNFSEVAKYVRQRNSTIMDNNFDTGSNLITVDIGFTNTLNDRNDNVPGGRAGNVTEMRIVYDAPLTFRTIVPNTWRAAEVTQNGVSVVVGAVLEGNVWAIYYNAVPNGGEVTIVEHILPGPATVTEVIVTPGEFERHPGQTFRFSAEVVGENFPAQDVTWSIEGADLHPGTTIDSRGVVAISALQEREVTLTIIATSVADPTVSGTGLLHIPELIPVVSPVANLVYDPHMAGVRERGSVGGGVNAPGWWARGGSPGVINTDVAYTRGGNVSYMSPFRTAEWGGIGIYLDREIMEMNEPYIVQAWVKSPDVYMQFIITAIVNGVDNHATVAWPHATHIIGPSDGWVLVQREVAFSPVNVPPHFANNIGLYVRTGYPRPDNHLEARFFVDSMLVVKSSDFHLLSDDGSIGLMTVNSGRGAQTAAFNPETNTYTINVLRGTTDVIVNARPTNANAWLELDGIFRQESSFPITGDVNTFTVRVFPENNQTIHTYTLVINVVDELSADTALSGLTVSDGTLTPAFDANTLEYRVSVANNVTSITITATSNCPFATVSGAGVRELAVGENRLTVRVTAEDGTFRDYVIIVTRASDLTHLTYTLFAEDWRPSINIRFFLDSTPVNVPLANMELVVDGVLIENIRDFTLNIPGWQTETNAVFICKVRHNWEHLTFTVTYQEQTLFFEFTNNMFVPPPVLTYTLFAEDWRPSINIRFFLDGVLAEIPLADMKLVVDGVLIENIRDFTLNIAGWQTATNAVFICKLRHNWEHLTLTVTAHGQTLFFEFINNMFVPPPPPPVLTTTIFAEDWRTTINIRFFLDGVLTALPLENIQLIADGVPVANIRNFTINVAGWQTETNAIFINKLGTPWQNMTVNITAYGQTLTYQFVNNMFVG